MNFIVGPQITGEVFLFVGPFSHMRPDRRNYTHAPSHLKHPDCKDSSICPKCTVFGYDRLVVRYSRDFEGTEILLPSESACACLISYASTLKLHGMRGVKFMDVDGVETNLQVSI